MESQFVPMATLSGSRMPASFQAMEQERRVAIALNELCSSRLSDKDSASLQEFLQDYFCPTTDPPSKS